MACVDLKPIRAGIADELAETDFDDRTNNGGVRSRLEPHESELVRGIGRITGLFPGSRDHDSLCALRFRPVVAVSTVDLRVGDDRGTCSKRSPPTGARCATGTMGEATRTMRSS